MKASEMTRVALVLGCAVLAASAVVGGGEDTVSDDFRISGDAERGERLFARSCAPCHGADGGGAGAVRLENVEMPDLRDRLSMKSHGDREIYEFIAEGGAAHGGCDRMLPAGTRLDERALHDLGAFVKTLPARGFVASHRDLSTAPSATR